MCLGETFGNFFKGVVDASQFSKEPKCQTPSPPIRFPNRSLPIRNSKVRRLIRFANSLGVIRKGYKEPNESRAYGRLLVRLS